MTVDGLCARRPRPSALARLALAASLVPLAVVGACAGSPGRTPSSMSAPTPAAGAGPSDDFVWSLPAGFPEPDVPPENPMSAAKVELGRRLFYDARLSGNGHFSCSSCHRQELAFTDGRSRAVGSTGEMHPRSAMSLTNVAYNAAYNWAEPTLTRLEDQALGPMLNLDPIELGIGGREQEVLDRLRADSETAARFAEAFPGDAISIDTVARAIAAFERTLLSGNSPYDRYLFWDEPLAEAAARGMELFFSERTRCAECHAGLNLSGPVRVAGAGTRPASPSPATAARMGSAAADEVTTFRAPTLRNIEVTAPYMHDGRIATLAEVVRFYAAGGRALDRPEAFEQDPLGGFSLTERELDDLLAFLRALTDREFLSDPRFSAPGSSARSAS